MSSSVMKHPASVLAALQAYNSLSSQGQGLAEALLLSFYGTLQVVPHGDSGCWVAGYGPILCVGKANRTGSGIFGVLQWSWKFPRSRDTPPPWHRWWDGATRGQHSEILQAGQSWRLQTSKEGLPERWCLGLGRWQPASPLCGASHRQE